MGVMQRSLAIFGCAVLLAVAAIAHQAVTVPSPVLACSCMSTEDMPLTDLIDGDTSVFAGTVGWAEQGMRVPVAVQRWFVGPGDADTVWIRPDEMLMPNGMMVSGGCTLPVRAGEGWFFVATGQPPDLLDVSMCSASAMLGTPTADMRIAEAAQLAIEVPTDPTDIQADATDPLPPWLPTSLLWLAVLIAVSGALFGVIVLIARRRPSD